VVPGRWLTFFVLNTGGVALDWFRRLFCRELSADDFYGQYLPEVLGSLLDDPAADEREAALPTFEPYLSGSRYSLEPLTASFTNVRLETTRDDLLLALVRGNLSYLGRHFEQVAGRVSLGRAVGISGGAARVDRMLDARRRWTGDFDYRFQDQSSMLGAAMLGQLYQRGGV
jgi:sugar (pentulose or hexulose) kinase